MKKICLIILLASINVIISEAKTFFIDPSGDDIKGNGSSSAPWKSLYRACRAVIVPGDVIHVKAGTYKETNESSLAPGVSIVGEGITTVLTRTPSLEWNGIIKAQSDEGTVGNQHISNLKFDGSSLTVAQAIWITGRSNVTINNCFFNDFKYVAIYWAGRNDQVLGPPDKYATGNRFFNNVIINCAAYADGYGRGALYLGGQEGMLIYNNYINQSGRISGTNGWPIKVWINEGYMKDCKIYSNTLYKDDVSNWDFAIEGIWFSGVEIYDNYITGSIDINHSKKGEYLYGLFIHHNVIGPPTFQEKTFTGIWCEFDHKLVKIEYNRFRNCAMGIAFTPRNGNVLEDFEISYNIFENCGQDDNSHYYSAIRYLYNSEDPPFFVIHNLNIMNNVFHANPLQNPWFGIAMGGFTSAKNINLTNNIFVNFYTSYFMAHNGYQIENINFMNNIIYNCGNRNEPILIDKPINLVKTGNIKTDPKLFSQNNFHPNVNSPAIKAGLPTSMLKKDFACVKLSVKPNIGAFEETSVSAKPAYLGALLSIMNLNSIELTFNAPLKTTFISTSSFDIRVNTLKRELKTALASGSKVIINLDSPIKPGDAISISYSKPNINYIQSLNGVDAPDINFHWIINSL